MEVILYSKECNWYTRCCPLNGGVRYRECPLREAILYTVSVPPFSPERGHELIKVDKIWTDTDKVSVIRFQFDPSKESKGHKEN